MRRFVALAALLVLGFASGCTKHALGQDEGRLSLSDGGQAEVSRAGNHPWRGVQGRATLHAGDRVRVTQGGAVVRLTSDRSVELRRGSQLELGASPKLLAGDLLVSAPTSTMTIAAAGTEVTVNQGRARLSRGLALIAAVYSGDVALDSAGRTLQLPSLRQAVITGAGLIPARPSPLQYDPLDAWDRRELGDAIELGSELVARSRGFTAQLAPGEGRTTGFYRQLLPDLDKQSDFSQSLLDGARSPGETLVGAAIATESRLGSFPARWANVFKFRDEGAAWGLVALDQSVSRSPLLSTVDEAIGRAATPFKSIAAGGAPPSTPSTSPSGPAPAPSTSARPAPSTPTTRPAPKPPASGGTVPPTTVPPVPPPIDQPTGGLFDTLGGLLDTLNNLLGGGH